MKRATEIDMLADMERVAAQMRARAERDTLGDHVTRHGVAYTAAFVQAHRVEHTATGTRLLLTRDTGMHTSGWLKNPDYDRCWHLSISPLEDPPLLVLARPRPQVAELDEETHARWVRAFFRENTGLLWAEPPYSLEGKARNVWHHRLFCDPNWAPILPHGEVYSREFTEAGWKSSSEVLAGLREEERREADVRAEAAGGAP